MTTDQQHLEPDPMLYNEIGKLETAFNALAKSLDQYTETSNRRFVAIEEKLNTPFPIVAVVTAITAVAIVLGALASFVMQPLFTDTERNRLALMQMSTRQTDSLVSSSTNEQRLNDQREWLQSLSDRERDTHTLVTGIETQVREYQRQAIQDRSHNAARLEAEIARNSRIEERVSRAEATLEMLMLKP